MKILFLHVYSEFNTGDAAIVEVMLEDYRARYPDADITLSTITKPQKSHFCNAPYVSSFFYQAIYKSDTTWLRVWNTFWITVGSFFHAVIYNYFKLSIPFYFSKNLQKFVNELKQADLVVAVGGGYILGKHSWQSTLSLFLTLLEVWFALQYGKTVHLYSQSIGPFATAFQKKMAQYVLNKVKQITVREEISRQQLIELNITNPKIKRAYDAAFYFTTHTKTRMKNYLMKRGIFFTRKVLGITVRNCFPEEQQHQYEKAIATAAHYAVHELGCKVVFIPHVTATQQNDDDRIVHTMLQKHMKPNRDIVFLYDRFTHHEVKGIYDNLDMLLGTRMHSVIFALSGGVPSIAVAYEPKSLGIMKQVGLEECVVMPEEMHTECFIKPLSHLYSHLDHYKSLLSKRLKSNYS